MKKQAQPAAESHKGFLELAGEALHVLGEEIVEGKDKVVETASGKFKQLKAAVGNLTHKKKAAKRVVKKAVKKGAAKKAAAKRVVKKAVKKRPAKKVAK